VTTNRFKVLLQWDPDDDVWVTHVPRLNHLSTFGETREAALDHTREAILGYLEAASKEGMEVRPEGPEPELVDVEVVSA
jgi:antitoxin HicB